MSHQIFDICSLLASEEIAQGIAKWSQQIANDISQAAYANKLITLFGNGGSAADSQHWAAELTATYKERTRRPYPAIALSTDTSVITAWSNDFDFSTVFSRQIEAFGSINGLAIGMSTSGNSQNVLKALSAAQDFGARTILISGNGCKYRDDFDLHVLLPSHYTPIVQTMTQVLYHGVCELLETL